MTIDSAVQTQIDTQILEQGAFVPLEFLLDSGRLIHDDYAGWRRREIDSLDEVLMGSPEKIRAQLESATGYARSIGLVETPRPFTPGSREQPITANRCGSAPTRNCSGSLAAATCRRRPLRNWIYSSIIPWWC